MKTYRFKPEFEEKLKRLRVKKKFLTNLKNRYEDNLGPILELLNNRIDWYNFIIAAFVWENTPEHHDFWSKIANHD